MIEIPRQKQSIPYQVTGTYKSANVMLKPAAPGTGIIAGGAVRAVLEVGGVNDVLSKAMGSRNAINVVKAVFEGLEQLRDAREIAYHRGKTVRQLLG